MGIIQAICISEVRGVQKHAIPEADLTPEWGIVGDAHGGNWHRQVSLLGLEKIEAFRAKGADVAYGCLLYTSPSPRDGLLSRMPSSA